MTEFRCPFCNGELELKAKQEPKKPFRYPKEFNEYWKYTSGFGGSKRDVYEWWKITKPKAAEVVVFPGDQE